MRRDNAKELQSSSTRTGMSEEGGQDYCRSEEEIERKRDRKSKRDSGAPHLPVSMGSKAVGRQTYRRHATSYRKQNKTTDEHTSCEQNKK